MADSDDAAGVVPEPRMHTGSTSGPIIRPEGLGLPAPERVWVDEADQMWERTHGVRRPGKEEGWADWPQPEREAELERREHNAEVEDAAELTDREQDARVAASMGKFRANAGNRAGKSSARVYGFGDFTFEYNSLTGDVTVTSRTGLIVVEPTRPGQARLASKRREGAPGVGIGE